ncbi:hypothetical protein K470DRAFT_201501, partial [Piedraia hortae CBS 480.64]
PHLALFFFQDTGGSVIPILYSALCRHIRSQGGVVLYVVSLGKAALLLPNGTTAHSR